MEVIFSSIKDRASKEEILAIFSTNRDNLMNLSFNLAYITIFERPLKLVGVMDEQFLEETIKKFEEFSLFKSLKEIFEKSGQNTKNMFISYGSDFGASSENFSFDHEKVYLFLMKS